MDCAHEMRYLDIFQPVIPTSVSILYRAPVVAGSGIGFTVRSYILIDKNLSPWVGEISYPYVRFLAKEGDE